MFGRRRLGCPESRRPAAIPERSFEQLVSCRSSGRVRELSPRRQLLRTRACVRQDRATFSVLYWPAARSRVHDDFDRLPRKTSVRLVPWLPGATAEAPDGCVNFAVFLVPRLATGGSTIDMSASPTTRSMRTPPNIQVIQDRGSYCDVETGLLDRNAGLEDVTCAVRAAARLARQSTPLSSWTSEKLNRAQNQSPLVRSTMRAAVVLNLVNPMLRGCAQLMLSPATAMLAS